MYATKQNMVDRFGEDELILLTNKDAAGTTIDDGVLDAAIGDAGAIIDGYLAGRYPLPLASVPNILTVFCCDMTRYQLYDDQAPDTITARYNNAIKYLTAVGKGELQLGVDTEGAAPTSNNTATVQSAGSVFARANSKGFI